MFLAGRERLDAAAGVRQFLADAARGKPDYRVLADRFSQIDQAMAVPRGRPPAGAAYVRAFVEEMKASGLVRKALDETGQDAANVAPPAV
jgi:polar amino acid transport system substrate-binding protein